MTLSFAQQWCLLAGLIRERVVTVVFWRAQAGRGSDIRLRVVGLASRCRVVVAERSWKKHRSGGCPAISLVNMLHMSSQFDLFLKEVWSRQMNVTKLDRGLRTEAFASAECEASAGRRQLGAWSRSAQIAHEMCRPPPCCPPGDQPSCSTDRMYTRIRRTSI